MTLDPHAIHIYTDGSCYGNPGRKGGASAIVHFPDILSREDEEIINFGCNETTNNRMELFACIRALEWVRENKPWNGVSRVQIFTDSRYVLDNRVRARNWKMNAWRNAQGTPIENVDLWNKLLTAESKTGFRVDFSWKPGKTSEILKRVDKAAKANAQRGGLYRDAGYKRGKVSPSKVRGAAKSFSACGQTVVVRPYRKDAPQRTENKIRFDLYDEATRCFTEKYYAFASDALTADLHRQHLYRVKFDNNPDYPKIEEIIEEIAAS